MKTPKEYTENIKKGIITQRMLIDSLYSVNKRAKNCRDKVREYSSYLRGRPYVYDKYNYIDMYTGKKEEYYAEKEKLLTVLEPKCIHREFIGYERRRIYDYEKDYDRYLKKNAFVWENCFWNAEEMREVWFGDIELKDKPKYHYYLFYDVGDKYTFHTPIEEKEAKEKEKEGLKIILLDGALETFGHEISDLLSVQFVKKMVALVDSKNYTYVPEETKTAEA